MYSFGLALVTTFDVVELKGDLDVVWRGIGRVAAEMVRSILTSI